MGAPPVIFCSDPFVQMHFSNIRPFSTDLLLPDPFLRVPTGLVCTHINEFHARRKLLRTFLDCIGRNPKGSKEIVLLPIISISMFPLTRLTNC